MFFVFFLTHWFLNLISNSGKTNSSKKIDNHIESEKPPIRKNQSSQIDEFQCRLGFKKPKTSTS